MTATVIDISSRFAARRALSRKEINKGIMERENEYKRSVLAARENEVGDVLNNLDDYAHLTRLGELSGGKHVAKNVRADLKKHFKGVKFSVKSDYDSINISWTDGPTDSEVSALVKKYKHGASFSVDDSYTYSPTIFNDLFGGVRFVSTSRAKSDDLRELAKNMVEHKFKVTVTGDCNQLIDGEYASCLVHRESCQLSQRGESWFYKDELL
ncbi:LPD29 domain-containing protein [Aeromonas veronii]|uniref:LPD29 domain-containing protein n=1 Tax=Aeromonas TaxID=642 RepID=UPI0034207C5D